MTPWRWRVLIFGSLAVAMLCFATLGVLYALEPRATIEVDIELAQPFLALDEHAELDKHYGSPGTDGIEPELGSVDVNFTTEDPAAVVEQIKAVMVSEGWTPAAADGMEWHSGPESSRWGQIFVDDDQVRLVIGVEEGPDITVA